MVIIAATTSTELDFKYSTAIGFKQDDLCFHILFCYQKSSERGETAIMSVKIVITSQPEGFRKACLLF